MKNHSILILVIMALWAGSANAKYSGGTGEPNDPYRIASAEDLNGIGNHQEDWDKHFILINDVNLATYTGAQFKIIGNSTKKFTGVFDGNNHKVWNFTWSSTSRSYVGLFGYVSSSGQIKNIGMENVDVNAVNGGSVGGLVGYSDGTITNCYSTGSITVYYEVGGLVGHNSGTIIGCYSAGIVSGEWDVGGLVGTSNGTITNCYSIGEVSGIWSGVGGLVGGNIRGKITNSYSKGKVTGNTDGVGGLVGYDYDGTITNCYSIAGVLGDNVVGGLVGASQGTITNCYSAGSVSGRDFVGGLVGWNEQRFVTASFWDKDTSGRSTSAGGTGKTTAEMKTMSTFTEAGWDFVEIWGIGENQTYPFLRTEPAGDSNHDKKVDLVDLAILASHWLQGAGP